MEIFYFAQALESIYLLFNYFIIFYGIMLYFYLKAMTNKDLTIDSHESFLSNRNLNEDQDILPSFFIKNRLIFFIMLTNVLYLTYYQFFFNEFRYIGQITLNCISWIACLYILRIQNLANKYYYPNILQFFFLISIISDILFLFFAEGTIEIFITILKFLFLLILFIYTHYKSYDKSSYYSLQEDKKIPRKIKRLIDKLETSKISTYIFGIPDNSAQLIQFQSQQRIYILQDFESKEEPAKKESRVSLSLNNSIDNFIEKSYVEELIEAKPNIKKKKSVTICPEIFINSAPQHKFYIEVAKNGSFQEEKGEFIIKTKVGNKEFIRLADYGMVEDLSFKIKEIYNEAEYFILHAQLPELISISKSPASERRSLNFVRTGIKTYLQNLVEYPSFLHKIVLDFLNISDQNLRIEYLEYIEKVLENKNIISQKIGGRHRKSKNKSFDFTSGIRTYSPSISKEETMIKIECKEAYLEHSMAHKSDNQKVLKFIFSLRITKKFGRNVETLLKKWKIRKNMSELLELVHSLKLEGNSLYSFLSEKVNTISQYTYELDEARNKVELLKYFASCLGEVFKSLVIPQLVGESLRKFFKIEESVWISDRETPKFSPLSPTKIFTNRKSRFLFTQKNLVSSNPNIQDEE